MYRLKFSDIFQVLTTNWIHNRRLLSTRGDRSQRQCGARSSSCKKEIQLKFLSKKTGNCKDSVLTLFGGIGQKDFKMDGEQLKSGRHLVISGLTAV